MTPETYNRFTLSFVDRVTLRALGCDAASSRLVEIRPSDHVLAGFLTPAAIEPRGHRPQSEEASPDDLPQDRPYEQSALGMEWLVPVQGLDEGSLSMEVSCSVFVRRLPTYEEQQTRGKWKLITDAGEEPASPIIPVWTREDLPPLPVEIKLPLLLQTGKTEKPLSEQMATWTGRLGTQTDLYPVKRPLAVPQPDLTPDGYPSWIAGFQQRPEAAMPQFAPVIDARLTPVPTEPGCMRLSLRVINRTPPPIPQHQDFFDPNLYAVRLTVRVPAQAHRPMEFADLPHSYRYDRSIAAVGINADIQEQTSLSGGRVFTTHSIPRKTIPRLEPREIDNAAPTFDRLVTAPLPLLRRILAAMKAYDTQVWQPKVNSLKGRPRLEATADRKFFQVDEIDAFERGIILLDDPAYPHVRRAFTLMNEAMQQSAAGLYDRWRLFQIVFIVAQIPRLAARHYRELSQEGDEDVDILWFAAGGGKTEAFMGLLVWQMFFDRLRGKQLGVTAFVRFPLRLLTFQQLRRTARVLAQAELIREREHLVGSRFSLGYFVGDTTTPNSIGPDRHARYSSPTGPEQHLRCLTRCPFCGNSVVLIYEKELRALEHWCERASTTCPGGTSRLPIYIVDTDIYRYLPTVIVSTVDKLALIGQNQRFGNLFGRFDMACPKHGVSFLDTNSGCQAAEAFAKYPNDPGRHLPTCEGHRVLYGPFVDAAPALLIQDELHLLSEETGTFDAHYETTALAIMRSLGFLPWKIIAATATIERFDLHAFQLYLRKARQFPCPGPLAYESFYYQVNPEKIGRIFIGVLGVGRKHTPAVTRLLSLLYQELQAARDAAANDLASVCQQYGLPLLSREEFTELLFRYELVLTYVLTRKGSDQVAEAIESRVKKELLDLLPSHGDLLLQTLNGGVAMAEMIDTMEAIELETADGDPSERVRGVVATNIIGHGVDINRFNIIVFGGFTRLVAEYIQASARVGRTFPGLSFFVVTPQSERDRSIFQRFSKFHEFIDRLVDPSAINRWPPQALERTVPGLLAGYLMTVAAARIKKRLESVTRVQQALGLKGAECLNAAEIVAWMREALGAAQAPFSGYEQELSAIVRNHYAQIINPAPEQLQGNTTLREILHPMQSLRDVDAPAYINVVEEQDRAILHNMLRLS